MLLKQIRQVVEIKLKSDPSRLAHTLRVYRTATKMARYYRKSILPIQIAALFHDYTKNDSLEQQKPYLTAASMVKYQNTPSIFHALSAANFLKQELEVCDKVILNAIKKHVWGHKTMNYADKIVFLSDKIEPGREYPQQKYFETLAYRNIHQAVYEMLNYNFNYFLKKGVPLPADYKVILTSLKGDIKMKSKYI
ncbi:bis(5'-nucleosyl)-tetraphosphatase (symmetrical) YqeK [Candidatus Phytoplasma meliae]|uniref:bis(5'-nucleosyl)-tetraphosphatase (symmetrical) n=1 Tax=Candidatus Phytoplasma meliae TaxID=1848402 RepID=A0ABS5CZ73_9MOLU|nr:bis(5'-nucleosyl)-tetraphosphatase (symmetrical) YqeK [Candidatus Phytoplasma meliae]MBP5836154.1 bis(5'-nucleosyl)-tetraphosphatase (symmetrical) YqeK [Candidatus Phytoplasma meliae]MBP5836257.1 bis(5'-nucleosyl)-tetraphosphatase (symmetrical) YqeK [Candidatus Phytoplasma meliae]